jgi:FkbM family methyltransferase
MLPGFLKRSIRGFAFPLIRGYVRYSPWRWGKVTIFRKIVEPYLYLRPREFTARTVDGMKVAGNSRDFIQSWIYFFGLTEPNLAHWLRRSLCPGDTFIDVGAHIGFHTLLASKLVGSSGAVVAIEASPSTYEALQRNLALNRVKNVRAVNIAASDQRGRLKFYRGPNHDLGSSTIYPEVAKEGSQLEAEVETAPLTEILSPTELKHARVIKIDVEGAEDAVVRGLAPALNTCREDLEVVVEIIPKFLSALNLKAEDVFRVFTDSGFNAYELRAEYRPEPFLSGQRAARPARIRQAIVCDANVILSRRDAGEL